LPLLPPSGNTSAIVALSSITAGCSAANRNAASLLNRQQVMAGGTKRVAGLTDEFIAITSRWQDKQRDPSPVPQSDSLR
jgi:hypothetical protein